MRARSVLERVLNELKAGKADGVEGEVIGAARVGEGEGFGAQVREWQEIATALLKQYARRYYQYEKSAYEQDFLELRELAEDAPRATLTLATRRDSSA